VSQRKYTDKNGIERYAFDVVASDMEMLTPKSTQSGSSDFLAGNADASDPLGDLEDHPF
jgi:single-strand DNA-binding protein